MIDERIIRIDVARTTDDTLVENLGVSRSRGFWLSTLPLARLRLNGRLERAKDGAM